MTEREKSSEAWRAVTASLHGPDPDERRSIERRRLATLARELTEREAMYFGGEMS